MPIYYCNSCKFVKEVSAQESITPSALCENCAKEGVKVYNTTSFIQQLFGFVQKLSAENQQLKITLNTQQENAPSHSQDQSTNTTDDINLLQTDTLATVEQHIPLKNFFERQNIKATFDYQKVNTHGFFDETAQILGDNYTIFSDILSKIVWAYNKKHNGLNYDLSKLSQNHGKLINSTCRTCYEHTLFARYSYQKANKVINLALQSATPIRQFFLGEWLEWYVLSQVLSHINKLSNMPKFSCARGVVIQFPNQDKQELDFVFLNSQAELFIIECKSGEYRQDLNKYINLRKRLNVPVNRFSILVTDVNEVQAKSMSAMYDINFITLDGLNQYIQSMVK